MRCNSLRLEGENLDVEHLHGESWETREKLLIMVVESPRQSRNGLDCFEPYHISEVLVKEEDMTRKLGLLVLPEDCQMSINELGPGLVQEWNRYHKVLVRAGDPITSVVSHKKDRYAWASCGYGSFCASLSRT